MGSSSCGEGLQLHETFNTNLNHNFDVVVYKLQLDFLAEVYLYCCSTILLAKLAMNAYWKSHFWYDGLQILPEKYSYYRRFDQVANHATDCVICMTAIDISQRSNDCMVF
jgi:hypothetical protein